MSIVRGEPKFAAYDEGYNGSYNSKLHIDDQVSYRHDYKGEKHMLRKKKLFISSLREKFASDTPASFTAEVPFKFKNVVGVRFIQVGVDYTPTATAIRNAFVYIPEFDHSEITTVNDRYHAYFPVVQGSVGTPVLFNYNFNDTYISDFPKPETIQDKLRINVYRENATTGAFTAFSELSQFFLELEFHYIDFC